MMGMRQSRIWLNGLPRAIGKGISRVCAPEQTLREKCQRMIVRMRGCFLTSSRVAPQEIYNSCPSNEKIAGTGFFLFRFSVESGIIFL